MQAEKLFMLTKEISKGRIIFCTLKYQAHTYFKIRAIPWDYNHQRQYYDEIQVWDTMADELECRYLAKSMERQRQYEP